MMGVWWAVERELDRVSGWCDMRRMSVNLYHLFWVSWWWMMGLRWVCYTEEISTPQQKVEQQYSGWDDSLFYVWAARDMLSLLLGVGQLGGFSAQSVVIRLLVADPFPATRGFRWVVDCWWWEMERERPKESCEWLIFCEISGKG